MATTNIRIAVAGGGIAGLTAAAVIARSGVPVTVFERASEPGGRAQTYAENGFRFNLGAHALYRGGQEVLADLGIEMAGGHPRIAGLAYRDGGLSRLPVSPWTVLRTSLLGPLDKAEYAKLFATIGRVPAEEWDDRTVAEWIDTTASRERVRELLHALVRLVAYTNAPHLLSAGAAIRQFRDPAGVFYVDGGWSSIIAALRTRATGNGADIRTGTRVEAIRRTEDGVEVVTRHGAEPFAAAIVTGGPSDALEVLGDRATPALREATKRAVPVTAAALDVGLRRLPRPRRTFGIGVDVACYSSVHSATAKGLAPAGGASISVMSYTPAGERVDAGAVERKLETYLDAMQPGWRDELVVRRFLPSLTVMNALPEAATGGLNGRPTIDAAGVPGVFVAGDWVGSTGLLADAAFASAKAAGEAAVAHIAASAPQAAAAVA